MQIINSKSGILAAIIMKHVKNMGIKNKIFIIIKGLTKGSVSLNITTHILLYVQFYPFKSFSKYVKVNMDTKILRFYLEELSYYIQPYLQLSKNLKQVSKGSFFFSSKCKPFFQKDVELPRETHSYV